MHSERLSLFTLTISAPYLASMIKMTDILHPFSLNLGVIQLWLYIVNAKILIDRSINIFGMVWWAGGVVLGVGLRCRRAFGQTQRVTGTAVHFRSQKLIFSAENCLVDDEHGAADATSFDAAEQDSTAIHRRNVFLRAVVRLRRFPRVDRTILGHLLRLRCSIRGVDICRSMVYGKTWTVRAAAADGSLERHAGHLQYRWCCQDHSRAGACAAVAWFWGVCMQVTVLQIFTSNDLKFR